ncbi:MAG: thioredoxin family protein [bacterium]|nr:thioredoxin family protein [bacterium]
MQAHAKTTRRRRRPLGTLTAYALVAMLGASLMGTATHATELPGKSAVSDFELTSQYVFELDGRDLEGAEIYYSKYEVAYLVIASELATPLLVSPRGHSVQRVQPQKLAKRKKIRADLGANAVLEFVGEYRRRRGAMIFTIDGKTAKLKPHPPVLGHQSSADVRDRLPKYAHLAEARGRSAKAGLPELPQAGENLKVRVYFGSWSPLCERLVPGIIAVEEKRKNPQVRFEYYGLPRRIIDDPVAREDGIYAVPTAVVYRDDEEIGRLTGLQLRSPAEGLARLLTGDPPR